ncbi:MAG: bifunctional (p)ppGpp synthetase/guanosine-3',5'-bis(diphosphate) 3'-pyrophosphohydrolase [Bacteroidales bacterium]|jgi:GTP pyrophosphokinase|nr:bifunctional (p)ppGpp synthetase/guanosine-3',5'-bis(diphosphate) 3'-pyrophosphohydrolase [Bacteroidales bacterium]MDN5348627.1 diphosphokinase / guanosine-3,5-bis(diphosphate) 3-diphosphatase [Bacteroidales bacterium]
MPYITLLNTAENQQIAAAYEKLKTLLIPTTDKERLLRVDEAFNLASGLYETRRTLSGKPYILHLCELALIIVEELGMGSTTVIAAFLHGTDQKTTLNLQQIESRFGSSVALIIEGFNKVSSLQTERLSYQSDNFRKLFLSLIEDIRVILLKIAHRLYDLRNPEDTVAERLEMYYYEVKHLYIPIAHRLGLYLIKAEFEERVMRYEHPDIYQAISEKITATKAKQEVLMEEFIQPIQRELLAQHFDCTIKWRTKSIPSIYAKMQAQNVEFEQVYDIFAIRIISNSQFKKEKEDCWRIYSIVTDLYPPNPKRLRDWITTPKASGYESLHTTVQMADGKWVEVQIRTERMDQIAEKGQAAHWQYKDSSGKMDTEEWLNQVRDILENPEQLNFDYSYRNTNKYHSDKIFIFTPNGDLKQLPKGSTVLDFAYEVHTQVGATCNGAKVNNRIVPIRHVLQNGDKVEIITNKKQSPKADWLNFVVTERARSKIKRFLREEELKEAEIGKAMLSRKLKNWKISNFDEIVNKLVKHYKTASSIELYHGIATDKIDLIGIKKILQEEVVPPAKPGAESQEIQPDETKKQTDVQQNNDYLVIDDTISNVNYRLAKCCNPIPGDSVFGFVTIGGGITIHRTGCPNSKRLKENYPYRIMHVRWKEAIDSPGFQTALRIGGKDTLGLVGEITKVISNDMKVNMRSISFDTRDGRFDGRLVLQIKDTDHLEQLIYRLGKIQGIERVQRVDQIK